MVSVCNSLQQVHFLSNPNSIKFSSPLLVSFSVSLPPALSSGSHALPVRALKTGPDGGKIVSSDTAAASSELLRRPIVKEFSGSEEGESGGERKEEMNARDEEEGEEEEEEEEEEERGEAQEWVDWEDKILEDTVPLVGFVRMILHSGRYQSGDRLRPDHEKTIVERLLPYHPEWQKKIGCGIDYITIGYHPDFDSSRCLFIVRKDGELVDFSYWKCIKGLIRKKYPLYADSFILRHFRRQRRSDRR